jgi:hypothetical protein
MASESELVPPVCLKSHWDPTAMSRRFILPDTFTAVPLPFRPATQVCREYVTSAPVERLPPTLSELPLRSNISPPDRYASAIDRESELRRLDRPLEIPEGAQFVPDITDNGTMFSQRLYIPTRSYNTNAVSQLEFPRVLMRPEGVSAGYACREAEDVKALARAGRGSMFNYSTKHDKFRYQA